MAIQKRAAIYCRVSTTLQAADEKTSLQHQERLCRERAAEDGLTVIEEYVVHDASSGSVDSNDRVALQRLLVAAERGAFNVVIMDLIDRTSRGGIFEFVDICNRFLRFEVTPLWASDREIDLTTQTGQLIAAAKAQGANAEKESIVRRFRRGRQDRIARGQLDKATMPYGYRWADEERTQFEPDPATAPIVQRIFRELAAGYSATRLALDLTAAGVPTPGQVKGRKREHARFGGKAPIWKVPTIAAILQNPAYKGERAHNRFMSVKRSYQDRRDRNLVSRAQIRQRDEADWTVIPVTPLVMADLWEQAQQTYHAGALYATRVPNRYTEDEVLLYGGYVRCAHCGYALSPARRRIDPRNRHTKRAWYYNCGHRELTKTGEPCKGTAITCERLDAFVWQEAVRLIRDPVYLQQLLRRGEEVWSPETQVAHYTGLLTKLDAEDAAITHELIRLSGKPGLDRIRARLEQDAAQHAELRTGYTAKLTEAQEELARRETQEQRVRTFAEWAAGQAPKVTELNAADRREILIHSLHPTVFVSRTDSNEPRVSLIFSVTAEAAARLNARDLYAAATWQGPGGEYYTVYADEFSDAGDTRNDTELDLSDIPSTSPWSC